MKITQKLLVFCLFLFVLVACTNKMTEENIQNDDDMIEQHRKVDEISSVNEFEINNTNDYNTNINIDNVIIQETVSQSDISNNEIIQNEIYNAKLLPFMANEIIKDVYFMYDNSKIWVEKDGEVVFKVSTSKYANLKFILKNDELLVCAITREFFTKIFRLEDGEELFSIPGIVEYLTKDNRYIISETTRYSAQTVDSAYSVYGVYDFEGNEILEMGQNWQTLVKLGYVDKTY